MKCAICSLNIKIFEFDLGTAFKDRNPITFKMAIMHYDCYQDAIEIAKQTPSKKPGYSNRYDEYNTNY